MNVVGDIVQVFEEGIDKPMTAWLARLEDGKPRPAVLLLADSAGVSGHVRALGERLAAEGCVVLAPNLRHRSTRGLGDGQASDSGGLVEEQVLQDLRTCIAYLLARPYFGASNPRVATVGFGSGGHAAYLAACALGLRAAVCFCPTDLATKGLGTDVPTINRTPALQGRVACFFGADDASIPPGDRERIKSALDAQGPGHLVVTYDGVGRGFFRDRRTVQDEAASNDAWVRMKAFLDRELGLRVTA